MVATLDIVDDKTTITLSGTEQTLTIYDASVGAKKARIKRAQVDLLMLLLEVTSNTNIIAGTSPFTLRLRLTSKNAGVIHDELTWEQSYSGGELGTVRSQPGNRSTSNQFARRWSPPRNFLLWTERGFRLNDLDAAILPHGDPAGSAESPIWVPTFTRDDTAGPELALPAFEELVIASDEALEVQLLNNSVSGWTVKAHLYRKFRAFLEA